jgi:hypothetical protein
MVPGNPSVGVLCGAGTRVVLAEPQVRALVEALNALKPVPPGAVYPCPADFGPTYGLYLDYANKDVLLVTVDASGCRFASNGQRSAWTDDALQAHIRALLGTG